MSAAGEEERNIGDSVILLAGGTEIPASRSKLSAVSPYFAGMFNPDSSFIESRKSHIRIKDHSAEAISKLAAYAQERRLKLGPPGR